MRLPTDIETVNNYALARRMHNLGMMPKLIVDLIPVTSKFVRVFGDSDPKLLFSRGYSKTWTNNNIGFKMSNILFKIYGAVSDDPTLQKGINVNHIATAWEVATIQYPELINEKICDISRFAYLLKKTVSNEYLVSECRTNNCCNKFIAHEDSDRHFCWACADNYSSMYLNTIGKELHIETQINKTALYAPNNRPEKERFNSEAFFNASRTMFAASQRSATKIVSVESMNDSQEPINDTYEPMVVNT
ncbi:hypothetical protein [Shewanella algicola]|uniref:hypothetical protein n=1 Tax=Shewanella algicola TaxID=640633 RepID=UPI002493FC00|nr:hypothetical protein [Shewanella algicola]